MKKLFGTDGIRAKAGEFPLDIETVRIFGFALAQRLRRPDAERPRVVTGRDTRKSGREIESAVHEGLSAAGAEPVSAGVITTPGVAFLASSEGFDAGVVVSASHNPFEDNGLKVFMPDGRKMGRESEEFIESAILEREEVPETGASFDDSGAGALQSRYLQHFGREFGLLDLSDVFLIADCANGSASHLVPLLFRRFGANVEVINAEPDGTNINRDCGSLHMEHLRLAVLESGADLGVAFDGDADRALFIDEQGALVDGDAVLWIMANYLRENETLIGDRVVATVMSNVGLEIALRSIGVELDRTDVGDKYVLEELLRTQASVGGEQSGHIIFPNRSLVGDGMQTALFVLDAMTRAGKPLSGLTDGFEVYPQILLNVPVAEKVPFEELDYVMSEKERIEDELDGKGRLLLRYSGTENLARVMIEGEVQKEIETLAESLAARIREEIGR